MSAAGLAAVFIVGFHLHLTDRPLGFADAFFIAAALMILLTMVLAARGRSFRDNPIAQGRIVAIVPAYNEDQATLYACIESLLAGVLRPDVIHVVDDGSRVPVVPFDHPRVVWHRQPNQGKRHAQVNGLRGETADFILTVDSDSIVDSRALQHAMRALSDPRIQAVTGNCVVRNRTQNLLTRLTDLEIVTGNLVMRRARSVLGVVAPTSGPFAVYRAGVLFDNVDDYLRSGTYGDDRRLTHYALLRGQVVACDDAVVEMEMPATVRAMFRQRTRWFQGYFRYLGWEIVNLDGAALFLRIWNLLLVAVYPFILAYALLVYPAVRGYVPLEAWAYWVALLYAQTLHYAVGRPGLRRRDRVAAWLFLTPLLVLLQMGVIRPAMYYAIKKVRSLAWVTRDVPAGSAGPAA